MLTIFTQNLSELLVFSYENCFPVLNTKEAYNKGQIRSVLEYCSSVKELQWVVPLFRT